MCTLRSSFARASVSGLASSRGILPPGSSGADCRVSRAVGRMRRERRDETEISARVVCYFLMHKLHHADTPHFYIVKLECTLLNLFFSGAWIVGDRRSCLLEAVQACTHNLRFVQIIELFQQTNLQQKIVIFSAIDKKRCIA